MNAHMDRFMAKVSPEPNSGCWLWTAHVSQGGYARFGLGGKPVSGHRVSYEMFVGPIPEGLDLDHKCRIRSCVNPEHLEPVTRSVNVRRGVAPRKSGDRMLAKTHCPQGHPYTGENLKFDPNGGRRCKICKTAQFKTWHARKVAKG